MGPAKRDTGVVDFRILLTVVRPRARRSSFSLLLRTASLVCRGLRLPEKLLLPSFGIIFTTEPYALLSAGFRDSAATLPGSFRVHEITDVNARMIDRHAVDCRFVRSFRGRNYRDSDSTGRRRPRTILRSGRHFDDRRPVLRARRKHVEQLARDGPSSSSRSRVDHRWVAPLTVTVSWSEPYLQVCIDRCCESRFQRDASRFSVRIRSG